MKKKLLTILSFSSFLLLNTKYLILNTVYASDPIGKIDPTGFGSLFSRPAIDTSGKLTGVILLVNLILRLIFIVAGLWTFMNFILAGFDFINAQGDSKKVANAWTRIWQSVVGLVIIVSSFMIAAILGMILYGNAAAILNPTIAK